MGWINKSENEIANIFNKGRGGAELFGDVKAELKVSKFCFLIRRDQKRSDTEINVQGRLGLILGKIHRSVLI